MDPGLSAAIRAVLGKLSGDLTETDLLSITELDASDRGIRTLEGMPSLPNLGKLYLSGNELRNLDGFPDLPKLAVLDLSDNRLENIDGLVPSNAPGFVLNLSCAVGENGLRSLENLPSNLIELYLGFNLNRLGYAGNNLDALPQMPPSLPNLEVLILNHNKLSSLDGLPQSLTSLRVLDLSRNPLTSLSGLPQVSELPNLTRFFSYLTPDRSRGGSGEDFDLVEQQLWDYREVAGESGYPIGGCSSVNFFPSL
jgi:Leucine-rich repeat (LRR) protein